MQFLEYSSWTYTYLVGDPVSKKAVLIDPVLETVERDLKAVSELGLTLELALNTHCHADHVTGTGELKKRLPGLKSVIGDKSGARADKFVTHGEVLHVGAIEIECRGTPGHTNGCMYYDFYCLFILFILFYWEI